MHPSIHPIGRQLLPIFRQFVVLLNHPPLTQRRLPLVPVIQGQHRLYPLHLRGRPCAHQARPVDGVQLLERFAGELLEQPRIDGGIGQHNRFIVIIGTGFFNVVFLLPVV